MAGETKWTCKCGVAWGQAKACPLCAETYTASIRRRCAAMAEQAAAEDAARAMRVRQAALRRAHPNVNKWGFYIAVGPDGR